jgi:hypothetical protein
MEFDSLKDLIYFGGLIGGAALAWASVKFQGKSNEKDIKALNDAHEASLKAAKAQYKAELGHVYDELRTLKTKVDGQANQDHALDARLREAISMDQAEKKFVTRREFDLTVKQLDVDMKAVKSIAQNTLDTLQTLVIQMSKQGK